MGNVWIYKVFISNIRWEKLISKFYEYYSYNHWKRCIYGQEKKITLKDNEKRQPDVLRQWIIFNLILLKVGVLFGSIPQEWKEGSEKTKGERKTLAQD